MAIVKFDGQFAMAQLQRIQSANARIIAALQPHTAFGRAIQFATAEAHRYAAAITHVDTGTLRLAHRMAVAELEGNVFLDPGAINPVSGLSAADYGPHEHARGRSHAFYERTVDERGGSIGSRAVANFMRALP